jgi:predicted ester cyclase
MSRRKGNENIDRWTMVRFLGTSVLLMVASMPGQVSCETLPVPHHWVIGNTSKATRSVELASLRYAAFWNAGRSLMQKKALADDFVDRTLPMGRAPGLEGVLQASMNFRVAVPDLTSDVDDMVVARDRASLHLHFKGHFTGKFKDIQGNGQVIDFQAFNLYRVVDGKMLRTGTWRTTSPY